MLNENQLKDEVPEEDEEYEISFHSYNSLEKEEEDIV
jgi:hypothetical protein